MAKPEEAKVGWGLAEMAKKKIEQEKAYRQAALEAAVSGNPHPDFDTWVKTSYKTEKKK